MGGGGKGGGCASGVGEETTVVAVVAWRMTHEAGGECCQRREVVSQLAIQSLSFVPSCICECKTKIR